MKQLQKTKPNIVTTIVGFLAIAISCYSIFLSSSEKEITTQTDHVQIEKKRKLSKEACENYIKEQNKPFSLLVVYSDSCLISDDITGAKVTINTKLIISNQVN